MEKKTEKIIQLLMCKTKKASFTFNEGLWELFQKACEKDKIKPTQQLEKMMINFIDNKKLL